MKKFTKQLLTGVIALGLLAPVATSSLNPIKTTVNAKRHHRSHRHAKRHYRSGRRGYLPKRFNGTWYARRTKDVTQTLHHPHVYAPVYMRLNRHGDYMSSPRYKGYFHPKHWVGGFYMAHGDNFGVINHGRTLVFNSETRGGRQADWSLHRI